MPWGIDIDAPFTGEADLYGEMGSQERNIEESAIT
jgi:hypothetical protein